MEKIEQKFYDVVIVGHPKKDNPKKMIYMRDAETPDGFDFPADSPRLFLHLELTEIADTETVVKGRKIFLPNPQAKPQTVNVFESQNRSLFSFLVEKLKENNPDGTKEGKETKTTFIPVKGDTTGRRIQMIDLGIPGNIVDFELPYPVVRMQRDPVSKKLVPFTSKSYDDTGEIVKKPVVTVVGNVFLYGNQCNNPQPHITQAIQAILKNSKKVEDLGISEDQGGAAATFIQPSEKKTEKDIKEVI